MDVAEHVEDLYWHHAVVLEDEWRAQIGEGPDKYDGRAGKVPGQHEGKGDAAEEGEAAGAHIARRVLETGVDVGHGRGHVEEHDGVEVEDLHNHHTQHAAPTEPVDGLTHQAHVHEQEVDGAEAGEHLAHAHGADEGRQDHGHQDEAIEQRLAPEVVAHHGPGHGHAHKGRGRRDGKTQVDAVEHHSPLVRVAHHQPEEGQGEAPVDDDGVGQHVAEGIEQEEPEEGSQAAQEEEATGRQVESRQDGAHRLSPPQGG